jgi:hypothetical protein
VNRDRLSDAIKYALDEGWISTPHPLADVVDVIAARVGPSPELVAWAAREAVVEDSK